MWSAASLGLELFGLVGGAVLVGLWLDERNQTKPLWTLVGLAVGSCAGFYRLFTSLKNPPDASVLETRDPFTGLPNPTAEKPSKIEPRQPLMSPPNAESTPPPNADSRTPQKDRPSRD